MGTTTAPSPPSSSSSSRETTTTARITHSGLPRVVHKEPATTMTKIRMEPHTTCGILPPATTTTTASTTTLTLTKTLDATSVTKTCSSTSSSPTKTTTTTNPTTTQPTTLERQRSSSSSSSSCTHNKQNNSSHQKMIVAPSAPSSSWPHASSYYSYHGYPPPPHAPPPPPAEPFPVQLHRVLHLCEEWNLEDIACFLPHGRAFGISQPQRLVQDVWPSVFGSHAASSSKGTTWSYLQRQFKAYGFVRQGAGHYYSHEYFVKGRPDLAYRIKRVAGASHSHSHSHSHPYHHYPTTKESSSSKDTSSRLHKNSYYPMPTWRQDKYSNKDSSSSSSPSKHHHSQAPPSDPSLQQQQQQQHAYHGYPPSHYGGYYYSMPPPSLPPPVIKPSPSTVSSSSNPKTEEEEKGVSVSPASRDGSARTSSETSSFVAPPTPEAVITVRYHASSLGHELPVSPHPLLYYHHQNQQPLQDGRVPLMSPVVTHHAGLLTPKSLLHSSTPPDIIDDEDPFGLWLPEPPSLKDARGGGTEHVSSSFDPF